MSDRNIESAGIVFGTVVEVDLAAGIARVREDNGPTGEIMTVPLTALQSEFALARARVTFVVELIDGVRTPKGLTVASVWRPGQARGEAVG